MANFDDLDAGLLESVLKWLTSTELRNSACLVCKRWLTACNQRSTQQGLWRVLDIDVQWEIGHPRGWAPRPSVVPWRTGGGTGRFGRGASRGAPGVSTSSTPGRRGVGGGGRGPGGGGRGSARPSSTFLSKAALSRWLAPRADRVEVLRLSNTETRSTLVGLRLQGPGERHDLQPPDLLALLAALPRLTELHLNSASNLLPDPGTLLNLPAPPPQPVPPPQSQPPQPPPNRSPTDQPPSPPDVPSPGLPFQDEALPPAGPLSPPPRPSPPAAPPPVPLADRLQRLSLSCTGYELRSDEGRAAVAALGRLRALRELTLTLETPSSEGLTRLPSAWSELTGLTALRLGGHRHLRRLPSWLPDRLRLLSELQLDACGLRAMPAAELAGLPRLRLLSLDKCPVGREDAAVSLDGWWPPDFDERGEGAAGGGGGGDVGWEGRADGVGGCRDDGGGGRGGGGGGLRGLEVLTLRECHILALPYAISKLTQLRRLDLYGNPLGCLPLEGDGGEGGHYSGHLRASVYRYLRESGDRGLQLLAGCPRLSHLGLASCGLAEVPSQVLQLTQLTSLDLSDNPMLQLSPQQLYGLRAALPQVRHLRLDGTAVADQRTRRPACDMAAG